MLIRSHDLQASPCFIRTGKGKLQSCGSTMFPDCLPKKDKNLQIFPGAENFSAPHWLMKPGECLVLPSSLSKEGKSRSQHDYQDAYLVSSSTCSSPNGWHVEAWIDLIQCCSRTCLQHPMAPEAQSSMQSKAGQLCLHPILPDYRKKPLPSLFLLG